MSEFEVLDPRFGKLVIRHAKLERLWSARWVEGPAYFPAGRYLPTLDRRNHRAMRPGRRATYPRLFQRPLSAPMFSGSSSYGAALWVDDLFQSAQCLHAG